MLDGRRRFFKNVHIRDKIVSSASSCSLRHFLSISPHSYHCVGLITIADGATVKQKAMDSRQFLKVFFLICESFTIQITLTSL